MRSRYVEIDDVSHLNTQAGIGGSKSNNDKLWRESYYFNMTDPQSGIGLITTIGILPNRKLITGFFLLIKDNKIIAAKPLIARKKPVFNDYSFELKGLEYKIEGINWRLTFESRNNNFDILFSPINKIYSYINNKSDLLFARLGTQHFEQFGIFTGSLKVGQEKITIGPCLGHRDHSWGIRDWSSIERYKLFCCAFSNKFAFNLWEGINNGRRFVKGYVFDGLENRRIVECSIKTNYNKNSYEPKQAYISILDENKKKYKIQTQTNLAIPLPPRQSIMYETMARMEANGYSGFGLQEYLHHEPNPVKRLWTFLKLIVLI